MERYKSVLAICFPMCVLLILLRNVEEQLKEQESY
ncbi:hypothetical protein T11_3937 [Trichinella zimbabwensis]|uniref:Uncharacterized protein n=1 Tax=Trichinella zimbabwensis TaxID=268475 RepID=A0A0V1G6V7_9BILA|nr:hypothetical protein T11_3937 [Trichinella zimbabwensis]